MSNHPNIYTFSGAMGFLMEAENQRQIEEDNKREQIARQNELNDVYNDGVDEYNELVNDYNILNRKYKDSINTSENYRKIALQLATEYQDFYNQASSVLDEKTDLEIEVERLRGLLKTANAQLKSNEVLKQSNDQATQSLKNALMSERQHKTQLQQMNEKLQSTNHEQFNDSKNKDEKLLQIKAGFQKVASESNSEKMTLKFVFTKFKVLKNVVDHLIKNGQLDKSNIAKIENYLISQWDTEDSKINAITASEAGAFLAVKNPSLFEKLSIN